ncbi:MAG: hypothetical protein HY749_02820 [Gammaproteobacteria bacterium]|nr:hypothetical protein [Gammaproteobacteria bacterium]
MKKGDSFQFESKWWKDEGAKTLPKSGLTGALRKYEEAKKTLNRDPTLQNYVAAKDALDEVDTARGQAIKLCVNKLHDETKEALVGGAKLFQNETVGLLKTYTEALLPRIKEAETELGDCRDLTSSFEKMMTKSAKDWQDLDDSEKKKAGKDLSELARLVIGSRVIVGSKLSEVPPASSLEKHVSTAAKRIAAVRKELDEINKQIKELPSWTFQSTVGKKRGSCQPYVNNGLRHCSRRHIPVPPEALNLFRASLAPSRRPRRNPRPASDHGYFFNSSFAICWRWTSSGPSARRSTREIA